MANTPANDVNSVVLETVAFVKTVIERFCKKERLTVSWSHGAHPVDVLDGAQIVDARMTSPLPLFGEVGTFRAGLTLSVVEEGGSVVLNFRPHHPAFNYDHRLSTNLSRLQQAGAGQANASMHVTFLGYGIEEVVKEALVANREAEDRFRRLAPVLPATPRKPLSMRLIDEGKIQKKKKRWA